MTVIIKLGKDRNKLGGNDYEFYFVTVNLRSSCDIQVVKTQWTDNWIDETKIQENF